VLPMHATAKIKGPGQKRGHRYDQATMT
jgi:hypothetical protein